MNKRHFLMLIAGLWLTASAPAMANDQVARVDHAAEHLVRAAEQWRTTTHYVDGRSRQAWLAAAVFQASRHFNDERRYRRPFDHLWASWEVLATRFFEARKLKHQLAYKHQAKFYGHAWSPYNMGHHQGYGSGNSRSHHGATYDAVQESWRRMADAFYDLHNAIHLERDRYYARNKSYRYAPTYRDRSVSVNVRSYGPYYRR